MKSFIKRLALLSSMFVLAGMSLFVPSTQAAFDRNFVINDAVFNNTSSMNSATIDNWLNANFPQSCISPNSGFLARVPSGYSPSGGFTYGGFGTAGQVIATAAGVYGLNPQVLIVTLQKEQSLVAGGSSYCNNGDEHKYAAAMGYGCPDGGSTYSYTGVSLYMRNGVEHTSTGSTCVNGVSKAGFSQQTIRAAWLLKFGQQRSLGNTGWAVVSGSWDNSDDPPTCYGGPMTQGTLSRGCGQPATYFDGYTTIDSTATYMGSGGTAALYWYTPHFSGNQNFYNIFAAWFGAPNSGCAASSNLGGLGSGRKVSAFRYSAAGPTTMAFTVMNNTGSACAEAHVWNSGYQSWKTNIATGLRATDPSLGTLIPMNFGDGRNGLVYVAYSGSGGFAEIHRLSPDFQKIPGYYDVLTNLSGVNANSGVFVAGDFFNRGYDQLAYVLYNGSGGKVEVHMFDPTLGRAVGYYDVETNLPASSHLTGTFVSGNFFGRGYDQLAYVHFNGSTGKTEVHVFDPTLRKAVGYYDVATDLSGVSTNSGAFTAGDYLGRGYEQLSFVLYSGNSGKVETHMFSPDLRRATGIQDIATNLPEFDVTQ